MKLSTACTHCGGTGQAKLSAPLARTLKRLGKRKLTANQLAEPGIVRGAIVNRLTKLEKLGLVSKAGKIGKEQVWRKNAPAVPRAEGTSSPDNATP